MNARDVIAVDPPDGALRRALAVLDAVAESPEPARFVDIQRACGLPKATLHRQLRALSAERLLAFDAETHRYSLGLRLVRLGHGAWRRASLAGIARPHLDALSAEIGETIHLAQLDAGQVLYVDKRDARRPLAMFSDAGKVGPAYCTGVGKALLAFLPEAAREAALALQSFHRHTPATLGAAGLRAELAAIRAAGVAFDREEHEPGIICVAAPVLAGADAPLGALSVTSAISRNSLDDLAALAPRLRETAARIATAAADRQSPSIRHGDAQCPA